MPPVSNRWLLVALLASVPMALTLSLSVGTAALDLSAVWAALMGQGDPIATAVVMELRLPRSLSGFAVGALLALSGALLQVLLRNPLADPYILGVSGGAAAFALGALLLGAGGLVIGSSAFAGALVSMAMVFGLSHARGNWSGTRLILTGVIVASGWGAVTSLMLALGRDSTLSGMLFWLMGDLGQARTDRWPGWVLLVGFLAALALARSLNVLGRGPLQAASLGVNVVRLRWQIYLLASLMTATAVSVAGAVGFVGLIVPHLLRLLGATDYRVLLPACAMLGGSLLVVADALARTLLAPQQLPVGVVMALLGVPAFLFLLQRSYTTQSQH